MQKYHCRKVLSCLLGNKKANIELVNHLFNADHKVRFVQADAHLINELVFHIKSLKAEVKKYYQGDERLLSEVDEFIIALQRLLGSLQNYNSYLKEIDSILIKFFTFTMQPAYENLQNTCIEPIIENLTILREQDFNAYRQKIEALCNEDGSLKESYIITRHRPSDDKFIFKGNDIKIYRDKEFVKLGLTAERLFFIGTPSFFDRKFSEMFFANETIFLGYACFENDIKPAYSFTNLISNKLIINTVYQGVSLEAGRDGVNYQKAIKEPLESYNEEKIIKNLEVNQNKQKRNIQAKIAHIFNNNFTFLPTEQSVTIIEKENFKIQQVKVKNIEPGDLLLFRTHSGSTLIKEVADDILGNNASRFRKLQEQWKKRLRSSMKKQGIETVVDILKRRYGISYVNPLNLNNWVSPLCIKPDALREILIALKFDKKEQQDIISASDKIRAAHIKAGHKISKSLINEINGKMEEAIGEKGYYKFESKEFKGASFNIEEVKAISKEVVMVAESDILKVFKK